MKLLITIFLKLDYYDPKKVNQTYPNFSLLNEHINLSYILLFWIYTF